MASLTDTEQLTGELERLVGEIRAEVKGDVDFERLVSACDEVSERADALAETFSTINAVLKEQVERVAGEDQSSRPSSKAKAGSRS